MVAVQRKGFNLLQVLKIGHVNLVEICELGTQVNKVADFGYSQNAAVLLINVADINRIFNVCHIYDDQPRNTAGYIKIVTFAVGLKKLVADAFRAAEM